MHTSLDAEVGMRPFTFTNEELDHLFGELNEFRTLLIAVSGGADSVALLLLTLSWAERQTAPPTIEVATVDHGLRPNSDKEAAWVKALADRHGVAHTSKTWVGEKPASGIQAEARKARYRLLLEVMQDRDLPRPAALLTAHTQDDQAETLMMRLMRGSGVDGLSAMAPRRSFGQEGAGLFHLRPLLSVPKARLVSELEAQGQTWLQDPTNESPDFERIQVRHVLASLKDHGLTADALALSAQRFQRARTALEDSVTAFILQHVTHTNGAIGECASEAFLCLANEIQVRVLERLLKAFGGVAPQARLSKIERLNQRLRVDAELTATLGGCVVTKKGASIQLFREAGRQALPTLSLEPGQRRLWDARFLVSVQPCTASQADTSIAKKMRTHGCVVVRELGADQVARLRGTFSDALAHIPPAAAATLPSFWSGDELLAVPSLGAWLLQSFDEQQAEAARRSGVKHTAKALGAGTCGGMFRADFTALAKACQDGGFGTPAEMA